jgi:hypothetical protein
MCDLTRFRHMWPYSILAILFIPFGFIASKYLFFNWLYDLSTLSVPDEGYYQKRVVYLLFRSTKKRNLIKANLRNIPATSIRIEEWFAMLGTKTFLSDILLFIFSIRPLCFPVLKYIIWFSSRLTERAWWRLFQKCIVRTKFDICVFKFHSEKLDVLYIICQKRYVKLN